MYRCALWHWIEELIENSFIFIGSEYSGCLRHTYCQALLAFLIGTATAVSLYIPKCSDSLISGQHQAGCQEPVAQCWGAVQHCSGGDGSGSHCSSHFFLLPVGDSTYRLMFCMAWIYPVDIYSTQMSEGGVCQHRQCMELSLHVFTSISLSPGSQVLWN